VRHYGGLGLGLFIVRQIVDSLGGRITVRSSPGNGSTFQIEMPVQPIHADNAVVDVLGNSRGGERIN
jgi:signal transduction histidine kinase